MNQEFPRDMRALPGYLRNLLTPLLPERAFLHRDRNDMLFVTNAPQFADGDLLAAQFQMRGFICTRAGSRLHLSPGPEILLQFESMHEPSGFFCNSLLPLRGLTPAPEAIALFARGVQLMENADPGRLSEFTRRTRQLAALCLRTRQGGAYACALIDHNLQSERSSIL